MAPLRSAVVLISLPPEEWRPELASSLCGVVVFPQDVTINDLNVLQDRKLPYILAAKSSLPGPHIRLGQIEAARTMTEKLLQMGHRRIALLTGYEPSLDEPKRAGVYEALRAAGIDPAKVPEFSAHDQESGIFQAAKDLLNSNPRPTAVVAFDDSLGSMLSFQARRNENLQVPGDLSIVSFHDWPYLNYIAPALTTVRFDFLAAGQRAAEVLDHASMTGETVTDVVLEPMFRPGQTIGPAPSI